MTRKGALAKIDKIRQSTTSTMTTLDSISKENYCKLTSEMQNYDFLESSVWYKMYLSKVFFVTCKRIF